MKKYFAIYKEEGYDCLGEIFPATKKALAEHFKQNFKCTTADMVIEAAIDARAKGCYKVTIFKHYKYNAILVKRNS